MTFTLTDSAGANPLVLVHGPATATDAYAQGPIGSEGAFDAAQKVDVWPQTRSDWVLVLPRKNHQASKPFGALRQFTTPAAAYAWAAQHPLAVQGLTRLVFVNGAVTLKLHGGMSTCRCRVVGVSVEIQYAWTYGRVEVTEA